MKKYIVILHNGLHIPIAAASIKIADGRMVLYDEADNAVADYNADALIGWHLQQPDRPTE